MTTERAELYKFRPPEGLRIPLLVQPAEVDDIIPPEEEIELGAQGLKGGRSGGRRAGA